MVFTGKKEKIYTCKTCGFQFSNLDVEKTCSNCFACSGCEIYICPSCKNEVVILPVKPMHKSTD